ncbi:uncharacterized protein [Ptychodera flava]|uniref:uncharacterized protein n=1 Tax=Ptychodera flava TaxID=63121 RepID=UPI00396A273C
MRSPRFKKMPRRPRKWAFDKGHFKKLKEQRLQKRNLFSKTQIESGVLEDKVFDLSFLHQHLNQVTLPSGWSHVMVESSLYFQKVEKIGEDLKTSRRITIMEDLQWKVVIHGKPVPETHTIFQGFPSVIDSVQTLNKLVDLINNSWICSGNADKVYISLVTEKGGEIVKAVSFSGEQGVSAYIESDYGAKAIDGSVYQSTVRSTKCTMLTDNKRCAECTKYRGNLRALVAKRREKDEVNLSCSNSRVNFRYLTKPQLQERAANLRKDMDVVKRSLTRAAKRLIIEDGIEIDKPTQCDIKDIMEECTDNVVKAYKEDSFQRLFWEEQLRYAKCTDSRQMRWHPTIIRWCLFLKFKSSACYDALRKSGFVKLPSQRTLSDYSNYIKPKVGLNKPVLKEVVSEIRAKGIPEDLWYVALLHDELKVKKDLVYDKYTGQLIGFVNLGNVNEELVNLERQINGEDVNITDIASHILVLMIRGLTFELEMSIGYWPTVGCRSDHLVDIIWPTISCLELSCGLKVLVSTSDGASWNRKFYRMHRVQGAPKDTLVYKCKNPHSLDRRSVYFISDVPHLVKTTRNCWANSEAHRKSRSLWNGSPILWRHLTQLVVADQARDIHLLHKLGYEHINLSSFSIMRVNLAAQVVLSESVANAIDVFGPEEAKETANFVRHMDKFFDCLNVRSTEEHIKKRKPNLAPYENIDDPRLELLIH